MDDTREYAGGAGLHAESPFDDLVSELASHPRSTDDLSGPADGFEDPFTASDFGGEDEFEDPFSGDEFGSAASGHELGDPFTASDFVAEDPAAVSQFSGDEFGSAASGHEFEDPFSGDEFGPAASGHELGDPFTASDFVAEDPAAVSQFSGDEFGSAASGHELGDPFTASDFGGGDEFSDAEFSDEFGLPDDDEESGDIDHHRGDEFDEEFDDGEDYEIVMAGEKPPEPMSKGAPFAPDPPADAHFPVRSSHRRGHIVNYAAAGGSHVGDNKSRVFGARRGNGARRHAGIDLYANAGDEVIACQAGTIVRFYGFCCGKNKTTNALVVDHGDVVINYGEVHPNSLQRLSLRKGSQVQAGQIIGYIGVNPHGSSMLHLEMYEAGVTRNKQWRAGNPAPDGLFDPSAYLAALAPVAPAATAPGTGSGAAPSASSSHRVLRHGHRGADVEQLQRALDSAGFSTAADGIFGSGTKATVKAFQRARGLTPDGVVGSKTWAALGIAGMQPEFELFSPTTYESGESAAAGGEVTRQDFIDNDDLQQVAAGRLMLASKGTPGKTPKRSRGTAVVVFQRALLHLGYKLPLFGADGDFGNETKAAVKFFQQAQGLKPDGIVGKHTIMAAFAFFNNANNRCRTPAPILPRLAGAPAYWDQQLKLGKVGRGLGLLAGNHVEPLVDGAETFRSMRRAIATAKAPGHYIYFLGWWCDPWLYLDGPGTSLLDLFQIAGGNGAQIRGLLWEPPRAAVTLWNQRKLNAAAAVALSKLPNTEFQEDSSGPTEKAHHQKMMVVSGSEGLIVFQGGVDVNADRLYELPPSPDTYRTDRPDVGWVGASGSGASGGDGVPLHDVHSRTTGPLCLPLLRAFRRRWLARSGNRDIDRTAPLLGAYCTPLPAKTGAHLMTMGETFDGELLGEDGKRIRSRRVTTQQIWLRSLLGARRSIYIEEQYLSHPCAAEAINRVLPRLDHVIIVIPPSELTDFPGRWKLRKRFIDIATAGHSTTVKSKLRVYTPVNRASPGECKRTGGPWIYLHSKMAIIDDELVLIGSANINHRGWETDSELVIAAIDEDADNLTLARDLRKRLWSKHLGVPQSRVDDPITSAGLWDTAASRHVCRYDDNEGKGDSSFDLWLLKKGISDPTCVAPGDPCNEFLGTKTTKGCAAPVPAGAT